MVRHGGGCTGEVQGGQEKPLVASVQLCSQGGLGARSGGTAPGSRQREAAELSPHTERRREENQAAASPGGRRCSGSPSLGPEGYPTFQPWTLSWPMVASSHEQNGSAMEVLQTPHYMHFKFRAQKYVKSVFHEHLQPMQIDHRLFAKNEHKRPQT